MLHKDWKPFKYSGSHPATCTCVECSSRNEPYVHIEPDIEFDKDVYKILPRKDRKAYKKAYKEQRKRQKRERKLAAANQPRQGIFGLFRRSK